VRIRIVKWNVPKKSLLERGGCSEWALLELEEQPGCVVIIREESKYINK
jgi:hypothetical protein